MAQRGQKYGRISQLVLLNSVSSELETNLIALQSITFFLKSPAPHWLSRVVVDIFYILKLLLILDSVRTSIHFVTFLMLNDWSVKLAYTCSIMSC